jgi:hypothetical protein
MNRIHHSNLKYKKNNHRNVCRSIKNKTHVSNLFFNGNTLDSCHANQDTFRKKCYEYFFNRPIVCVMEFNILLFSINKMNILFLFINKNLIA